VIIDPADDLETGAVNALLKSLEEPPAGTFFLLVAHRIGRLLPTIRSRCRILRFAPLEAGQVDLVLSRAAPRPMPPRAPPRLPPRKARPAWRWICGAGSGPVHALMQRLVAKATPALRGALSAEIGARPTRERIAATFELARAVLADGLRHAPRPGRRASSPPTAPSAALAPRRRPSITTRAAGDGNWRLAGGRRRP
jgi:DNA polymerase-3 subunit delta'